MGGGRNRGKTRGEREREIGKLGGEKERIRKQERESSELGKKGEAGREKKEIEERNKLEKQRTEKLVEDSQGRKRES